MMKERFEQYITLLRKSKMGKLTSEEQKEFETMLSDKNLQKIYGELDDGEFILRKLEEYKSFSAGKAYHDFYKQVHTHRNNRLRWGMVAAVAAILLCVTWVVNKKDMSQVVPHQVVENTIIKPGDKKALLKLADGNVVQVVGDSMRIKEQRGALIDYIAGGLSYKSTDNVKELVYNELIVPVAGECYITLEDGTRVWINSDSKLKYPVKFVGKERKVYLEGEAYFEVMKDSKPFIVNTALGEVNVLGTSFDVKAYKEDQKIYTTLVSGRVNFKGQETIEISPGEQIVAFLSGKLEKRSVDIAEYIGWKEGLYVFRNQSLETIMTDLARWYNISVFFRNPDLKRIEFTGNLKRYDNINAFMELLGRTGDIKYTISGNTIVLFK